MKTIAGIKLESLPVTRLTRVRDLVYFDGPLLTEFVHGHGDRYLRYWCDCDETANRWMLLRVSETSIVRLTTRAVPLDYIIPNGCQDDFVYFIDVGTEGGHRTLLTGVENIPDDYRPEKGVYLDIEETSGYAVLLDGGHSTSSLMKFPRVFEQLYAFLYAINVLGASPARFPWRGGYSSMHFNSWISSAIPAEDRPNIAAFHVSSPGFVRFSLRRRTAEEVATSVGECSGAVSSNGELAAYIRNNKLNDIEDPDAATWEEHEDQMDQLGRSLASCFRHLNWEQLRASTPRSFEAAQMTRWFYRRAKAIADLERDGLVRLPPV